MRKMLIIALLCLSSNAIAQHLLYIPDTLSGTSFNLTVHKDSVQFFPGIITQTFGINANNYMGPTLILKKGDSVSLMVNNEMGDTTTMHWHGLHIAPKNDGGPSTMIMHGMSWNPKFVVRNNAATYWYHPHMMAKTAAQAIKGDVGLIIIRDNAEAALQLPRKYGVDDFPIVVQSVELDNSNQFMPIGMVDSVILVNGTIAPYISMPSQIVRLRLLNGSGERTLNFGFSANKAFYVIGNDNGLLPTPVSTTRIRLSPGERAELLLDISGLGGQTIYLKSYGSELPMGVQGGPTMPMPASSPPMNSSLNGVDFNILRINIGNQTATPVTVIPSTLIADNPYPESSANTVRTINMTADSLTVMDGLFYFNDSSFNMMRVDYRIPLNNVEIWKLTNQTMVAHPFHIHDVHFYILDRDGNAPAPVERGRKDVLLIQPNETVRFITKFDDFADTTTPYMYHCHILMHEDDGMMGQFVVGRNYTSVEHIAPLKEAIAIYPNPATTSINLQLEGNAATENATVVIYDAMGKKVYTGSFVKNVNLNTSKWAKGIYIVSVHLKNETIHKRFIIE
jgi:blue copper oxidase